MNARELADKIAETLHRNFNLLLKEWGPAKFDTQEIEAFRAMLDADAANLATWLAPMLVEVDDLRGLCRDAARALSMYGSPAKRSPLEKDLIEAGKPKT